MAEGQMPLPIEEPQRSDEETREAGNGDLPEGWSFCRFDYLVEHRRESADPQRIPESVYVGLEHIDSGNPKLRRHGRASEVKSNKSRFYEGDILYGKLRPYLDKGVLAEQEGICSTDILVLTAKPDVERRFILYAVHARSFLNHAAATTSGVNHPRTSWASLRQYVMPTPPLEEQREIARILDAVQGARETTERVIAAAHELKRSMMDHLFTFGSVPLTKADTIATKDTEAGTIPESRSSRLSAATGSVSAMSSRTSSVGLTSTF